jgi:hypothetical protein
LRQVGADTGAAAAIRMAIDLIASERNPRVVPERLASLSLNARRD